MSGRYENPDKTPVAIPVRFTRSNMVRDMRTIVRGVMSDLAESQGQESFFDANDFNVDDDPDALPTSVHEYTEMQEDKLTSDLASVIVPPPKMEVDSDEGRKVKRSAGGDRRGSSRERRRDDKAIGGKGASGGAQGSGESES